MPIATRSATRSPPPPRRSSQPSTPASDEVRERGAEPHQRSAAERLGARGAQLEPLERGVDAEEDEQPDREREQELEPAPVELPHPRQPEHPDRHRDDPDVEADQPHQAVEAGVRLGRLRGHLDRRVDGAAGRREQDDLVGLALDPRIVDRHERAVEPAELVVVLLEGGEAVVDDRLHDLHRVRPVVAQLAARSRPGAAPCARPRPPRPGRRCARAPGRRARRRTRSAPPSRTSGSSAASQPRPAPAACGRGLHHVTSKKPIQPSSANSDTCAWNMYLPSYGKRSSRIPRWPWPWITVSVSSVGSSDVPVG